MLGPAIYYLPESPGNRFQGDVLEHDLRQGCEIQGLLIHLVHILQLVVLDGLQAEGKKPWSLQEEALDFVRKLLDAPIDKIALENPESVISILK